MVCLEIVLVTILNLHRPAASAALLNFSAVSSTEAYRAPAVRPAVVFRRRPIIHNKGGGSGQASRYRCFG